AVLACSHHAQDRPKIERTGIRGTALSLPLLGAAWGVAPHDSVHRIPLPCLNSAGNQERLPYASRRPGRVPRMK
ncbi:hypothetical protein GQ53DRAFT_750532, partial [Thozetella sp. PMI_491]